MPELRYIEVRGTPRVMGESLGEAHRGEIQEFVSRRLEHLIGFVSKYDPERALGVSSVLEAAESLLDVHRNYDQQLWEEFAGIARGAGMTEAELLIGNALTDVRDLVLMRGLARKEGTGSPGKSPNDSGAKADGDTGECTVFGASAEACGGSPIIGQTWDMHPDARDFLLVIDRRPEGEPATLTLTTVGCLSLTGVNSEGVGICTSNLIPTDARVGVCYLFTISKALTAMSAAEAASVIERTDRLSGHCFMLADDSSVVDVETTACHARSTSHTEGVRVHSNHYLDEELAILAYGGVDTASSKWRMRHLDEAFRDAARPVDEALCWDLLSDAARGDGAVCNEDYEGRFGDVATAATVVADPSGGSITACAGGARLGEKHIFRLG
jgi:hypothetical protein